MPADLAVIGLGHLGLPLAQAAVGVGIHTVGYDTDPRPFAELSAGRTPVEGSLSASDIRRMVSGGFRPTADPAELGRVRTAAICAPTPLGPDRTLDLGAVTDAARAL
ncbi:nucleotide sugar dehydrogenase, partial [Streptomyces sp. FT05W]